MKKLKISPGAAGVIALTALFGFVDGNRENIEGENISRGRIALVGSLKRMEDARYLPENRFVPMSDKPIYLVEIRRGNKFSEVIVDAVTGRILSS